jgi:alanine dehydrogenase
MIDSRAVCIANITVHDADKTLPLLTPMSAVAGRIAIPEGIKYLEKPIKGKYMLKDMQPGTVLVDVAADQTNCFEITRPTTHEHPTYIIDDVVHYCVTNMPSAVHYASTLALTNVTLPYILKSANLGWEKACERTPDLNKGLSIVKGKVVYETIS